MEDKKTDNKKSFVETVSEKIIEQLKAGTAPWQKTWHDDKRKSLPYNPISDKRYKGINTLHLMAESMSKGYSDPRWLTYKQAKSLGAQVRTGEKSTLVQYWKFTDLVDKLDEDGKPVLDENGKKVKEEVELDKPRVFYANVFNAEQIDNLPPLPIREQKWNPIERAETILENSGAKILNDSNSAYYSPKKDEIHLPGKEFFDSNDKYYSTVLHELGHWTGAESRLNRDLSHPFGSQEYAREELRAEIASMIIGDELNIGHDSNQHVAYVESWIKILQDEPKEIFRAAADAEKIQEYIFSFELEQKKNLTRGEEIIPFNQLDSHAQEMYLSLKKIAEDNNFVISITKHEDCLYKINYIEKGKEIEDYKITTEIYEGGLASTCVNDLIVPGRKATSDIEEQGKMFLAAIELIPKLRERDIFEKYNLPDLVEIRDDNDIRETDNYVLAKEWAAKQDNYFEIDRPKPNEMYLINEKGMRVMFESEILARAKSADNPLDHELKLKEDELGEGHSWAVENTILHIPYAQKETAKEIAGKLPDGSNAIEWDNDKKIWFAKPGADLEKLKPWISDSKENLMMKSNLIATEKVILAIPYSQKETAKKMAGKLENGEAAIEWDKVNKVWFAKPGADLEKLKPWMPENVNTQTPALSPREEFSLALQSMGCIVDGEHPIMDGQNHRIKTEGDKPGQKAGFYKAFLDGQPAGYIKNNRTGAEMKWKSKGYHLSDEEKAKLSAEAAKRKEQRAKEQAEMYEKVAEDVKNKFSELPQLNEPTQYLLNKKIDVYPGLATDKDNKTTYVPGYDENGKQWTTQYIKEDGQKGFEKGSKKTGCFHVVGGQEALNNSPVIIISEGYATAATITKVVGYSTVAAFDSGNLKNVAKALHEKYPQKPIIVAGDDDRHLEEKQGVNPGRDKAIEAAKSVNGSAIFPIFAPSDQKTKLTDFNDLVTKSQFKEAAVVQIQSSIKANVERQVEQRQKLQNQNQNQIRARGNTLKIN